MNKLKRLLSEQWHIGLEDEDEDDDDDKHTVYFLPKDGIGFCPILETPYPEIALAASHLPEMLALLKRCREHLEGEPELSELPNQITTLLKKAFGSVGRREVKPDLLHAEPEGGA